MPEDDKPLPTNPEEVEEEEEEELPDDTRVQIIAGMLAKFVDFNDELSTVPDNSKTSYQKLYSLANIVTGFLLAIPFLMKPGWCSNMQEAISGDCEVDRDGIHYNMSFLLIAPARICLWTLWVLQLFVVLAQFYKFTLNKKRPSVWVRFIVEATLMTAVFVTL